MNSAIALPVDAPAVIPAAGATRVPAAQATGQGFGQGFGQCLAVALFPLLGTPTGQAPASPTKPEPIGPATPDTNDNPMDLAPAVPTLMGAVPSLQAGSAPVVAAPDAPMAVVPDTDTGAAPPALPLPIVPAEPDATAKPVVLGKPNTMPGSRSTKGNKDDLPPAPLAATPLLTAVAPVPPLSREPLATPATGAAPPTVSAIDTASVTQRTPNSGDRTAPAHGPEPDQGTEPVAALPIAAPAHAPIVPGLNQSADPARLPPSTDGGLPPSPMPVAPPPVHDVTGTDVSAAGATRASPAEQVAPAVVSLAQLSGGTRHVTVQLQPNELGQVQIRIVHTVDTAPRIEISAERPQTLALLQRDEPQLHRALDQAGITPEGRALTFHLSPVDTQNNMPSSRTGDATFDLAGQRQGGSPQSQSQGSQSGSLADAAESEPQPLPMPSMPRWFRAGIDITA